MVMRTPPAGTRPMELHETADKTPSGSWVDTLPPWITRDKIQEGRARYDQFCRTCHGVAGDANSAVADAMPLRRPPSFVEPRLLALTPGEIHDVVEHGYGFMPSYASKLGDDERWEVVAYVCALRRSRHAIASELPADVATELQKEAP
jgi:mono/diheme cytochrome c family protein